MRKVIYQEYVAVPTTPPTGRVLWKLEDKGEAVFHQFGSNYEEFEAGPGNYTTAVIELPDGTIKNVPVEHVRFLPAHPQGEGEK